MPANLEQTYQLLIKNFWTTFNLRDFEECKNLLRHFILDQTANDKSREIIKANIYILELVIEIEARGHPTEQEIDFIGQRLREGICSKITNMYLAKLMIDKKCFQLSFVFAKILLSTKSKFNVPENLETVAVSWEGILLISYSLQLVCECYILSSIKFREKLLEANLDRKLSEILQKIVFQTIRWTLHDHSEDSINAFNKHSKKLVQELAGKNLIADGILEPFVSNCLKASSLGPYFAVNMLS